MRRRRNPDTNQARKLRADGFLPVMNKRDIKRLRDLGVAVQVHDDALVMHDDQTSAAWAPRWAIKVIEAEPCNDEARDWALKRATQDESFMQELDALARLVDDSARGRSARAKMADYIMELWEPES